MSDESGGVVVALVSDLPFSVRISDAIQAAGGQPILAESPDAFSTLFDRSPVLVVIDLTVPGWQEAVRQAKASPKMSSVPLVAFGNQSRKELLDEARRLGCNHVWARSYFVSHSAQALARYLGSAAPSPDVDCNQTPPDQLLEGVRLFNDERYWECHETLEVLWRQTRGDTRYLYQGILQIGVAFYHLRKGNVVGAEKMLRRGLPRLRQFPDRCQGVQVRQLERAARAVLEKTLTDGPRSVEWSAMALPTIEMAGALPSSR